MLLPGPAQVVANPGGGGLPDGGTTGQILDKLSGADQDAGWVDPAVASNATPIANGIASPGVGTNYSRDDHVHPGSAAGVTDSYTLVMPPNPQSGWIVGTPITLAGATFSIGGGSGPAIPFRITNNATVKFGLRVTSTGGVGSVLRLGVFLDDNGGISPGTLVADLGTISGTATGNQFASGTVTLSNTTRYWFLAVAQVSGSGPTVLAGNPLVALGPFLDGSGTYPPVTARIAFSGAFSSNPSVLTWDYNQGPPTIYTTVP